MFRLDEIQPDIFRINYFDGKYPVGFSQFLIRDERPTLIHTGIACGGMDRFLAEAPGARLVCSDTGAKINLSGWNAPAPHTVWQDDRLDLGRHRLRFLMTPHVHHWDSMMVFEETAGALFPADLFIQPGDVPPVSTEDRAAAMIQLYRTVGIMPSEQAVRHVLDQMERLPIRHVNPMHGSCIPASALGPYVRALREQPFAYNGTVFGRSLF
jgi:flavorubredoxin